MGAPICLVRWLPGSAPTEVEIVTNEEQHRVDLFVRSATTAQGVLDAIAEWGRENPNTQCFYIAAHGLERRDEGFVGLYAGDDATDWLSWLQLGEALTQLDVTPVAWLGACGSAAAIPVWSDHLLRQGFMPASWVIAFVGGVHGFVVEATLRQAVSNMTLSALVFVESELPSLREAAGPAVKMFYPAHPNDTNRSEYVDVDSFPKRIGRSFSQFIGSNQRR